MFGQFIKSRRQVLDISQSELATRLTLNGYSTTKASVGHWETSRNNPPVEDAEFRRSLAAALEMDVNELAHHLGFVDSDDDRSSDALLAASIVDRLPPRTRHLAIEYLKMLDQKFSDE